jgi:hypothetical protein
MCPVYDCRHCRDTGLIRLGDKVVTCTKSGCRMARIRELQKKLRAAKEKHG